MGFIWHPSAFLFFLQGNQARFGAMLSKQPSIWSRMPSRQQISISPFNIPPPPHQQSLNDADFNSTYLIEAEKRNMELRQALHYWKSQGLMLGVEETDIDLEERAEPRPRTGSTCVPPPFSSSSSAATLPTDRWPSMYTSSKLNENVSVQPFVFTKKRTMIKMLISQLGSAHLASRERNLLVTALLSQIARFPFEDLDNGLIIPKGSIDARFLASDDLDSLLQSISYTKQEDDGRTPRRRRANSMCLTNAGALNLHHTLDQVFLVFYDNLLT